MEVETKDTSEVLGILRRFVDPSDFIPASKSVIFHNGFILLTAVWGGCIYYGGKSFLTPEKSLGIDTMMVPDLSTILQVRKSEKMKVEYDETMVYFSFGKAQVKFGVKEVPMPWDIDRLLSPESGAKPIAESFLPTLSKLSFSISDNAYKSQFGGVWYSEEDKKVYASDNNRITCLPLGSALGTDGNFFVPAVFLKKIPIPNQEPSGIAIDHGLCLFFYDGFTPFFLLTDVKMPPFMTAFSKARESAVDSNLFFKLDLNDEERKSLVSLKTLFYDPKGGASDVSLVSEGDTLKIEILHKQTGTERGFVDYLPLAKHSGEINVRIDSQFFLEAVDRFDTFNFDTGKTIYAHKDGEDMEQLIAWKR